MDYPLTISGQIQRINDAKKSLKNIINDFGGNLTEETTISEYAEELLDTMSNLGTASHLTWLLDYKTYGNNSYVYNDKDKLHELYNDIKLSMNDIDIMGEALEYAISVGSNIGNVLSSIYSADTINGSTIDSIIQNSEEFNKVISNDIVMRAVAESPSATLRLMGDNEASMSSTVVNAICRSWKGLYSIYANESTYTKWIGSESAAAAMSDASSVAVGKAAVKLGGLNPDSFADMQAVAASQVAMTAVAASQVAMTAVASSQVAMQAVAASQVAMTAVLSSQVAMQAVASSQVAMQAVLSSQVAMTAVLSSQVAMTAVAASQVAMQAVASSQVAMTAVAASAVALNAICKVSEVPVQWYTAMQSHRDKILISCENSNYFVKTMENVGDGVGTFDSGENTNTFYIPISCSDDNDTSFSAYDTAKSARQICNIPSHSGSVNISEGIAMRGTRVIGSGASIGNISFVVYTAK